LAHLARVRTAARAVGPAWPDNGARGGDGALGVGPRASEVGVGVRVRLFGYLKFRVLRIDTRNYNGFYNTRNFGFRYSQTTRTVVSAL
jgi:hypothetical protein